MPRVPERTRSCEILLPYSSELSRHVSARARPPHDAICVDVRSKSTAHRIMAQQAHGQPHRRDEPVKDHTEDDWRVDPAQGIAQGHPGPIHRSKAPGQRQSRKDQRETKRHGPEPRMLATDHCRPQADCADDPSDHQAEVAERLFVTRDGHHRTLPVQSNSNSFLQSVSLTRGFWFAFSSTQFSSTRTSISVRMKHRYASSGL